MAKSSWRRHVMNSCIWLLFLELQGMVDVKFQIDAQTLIHIITENRNRHACGPVHSFPLILLHKLADKEKKSDPNMTDVWSVTGNIIFSCASCSAPITTKIVSVHSWSFRAVFGSTLKYPRRTGESIKSVPDLTTSTKANTTSVRVAHL